MSKNKKIIASFELTLMIIGIFAFSYGVAMTDDSFQALAEQKEKIKAEKEKGDFNLYQFANRF